ncbi:DUF7344 domain-containing protein [Halorarius halobius]|uniref:DUF7344 domain-containing protein n=1 Tax=Halorarius halobius TaxID=2962671 RepID=UPI0020CF8060|nr:hypothetical protein [Halorarius halobius]
MTGAGVGEVAPGDETHVDSSTGGQEASADALGLDQVFETLKNHRRRLVLNHLRDHDGRVEVGKLSRAIAAAENEKPEEAVTSDERKRAYVGLYQCHLPKMDSMGIVEFEKSRGRVSLGPNAEPLFRYIDTDGNEETEEAVRWHVVYGALAAGSLVAFGVALLAATATPWLVVPAFALVVLALSATAFVHVRTCRWDSGE